MGSKVVKYRLNSKERRRLLDEVKDLTGESTDTSTIDAALETFLQVVENYEDVKDEVPPEVARKLSTERIQLAQYPQVKVR